jgi:diguanylate cyclase (GGDEF)-like protein
MASKTDLTGQQHLAVLNEIARIASGELELRNMLAHVTQALHRHFGWELIGFITVDQEAGLFTCEALHADRPAGIEIGDTRPFDSGVVGSVIRSGQAVVLDDVRKAPHYIEINPETRSEVCLPVKHRGRLVAILNIESSKPAAFCDQLPLLETVAEQVAGAIESARIYEALMEHAVLSEVIGEVSRVALEPTGLMELMKRITDYIIVRFPVSIASIQLLDDSRGRFVTEVYSSEMLLPPPPDDWSIDMGICGRCVREGRALLVDEPSRDPDYVPGMDGIRTEFVVPIRYRGGILGVLNLESHRPKSFTPAMQQVFEKIAEQIAGAIEGARLEAQLQEHARDMEMLSRLSRLATQGDDLHTLLHTIAEYLAAELDIAVVSILLLDDAGTHFVLEAVSGELKLRLPGDGDWPVTAGVCGRCARTGEPQLVYADAGDPDYFSGHADIRAEYVLPIRYNERVLGLLNLESTRRDSFSLPVQRLCTAVADQVAGVMNLAMVNSRLMETNRVVEERTRELKETNDKLKRANLELHRISSYDALTGIPNRRRLDEVLAHEWRWAKRTGRPLSFMLADLDHFKALNDSQGHVRGDECLRLVAQALADGLMRPADFVARYGGEEFALVLPDLDAEGARRYAESLRARVEALQLAHSASPVVPYITISVGSATVIASKDTGVADAIAAADEALYEAKHAGRNRVAIRHLSSH